MIRGESGTCLYNRTIKVRLKEKKDKLEFALTGIVGPNKKTSIITKCSFCMYGINQKIIHCNWLSYKIVR
jgi:hypothetical protein